MQKFANSADFKKLKKRVIEVSTTLRCLGGILQTTMDLQRNKKEYEIAIIKREQFQDLNEEQKKEFL